ncbi:MAG TPA: cytochrome c biogenesis protein ResB [Candidatus Brachybacterium merdavium]|uniref:Cytochrome c biogenesis protein ResB n=1 Tax=Candidatus Brachybacterium merdavium TaxID=2838513 RepID=A0A9D2RNE7_9MICO|nr:cytochrome c biogenesis protein ResB [Candidatus Brachybacterium merdavium]
MSDQTSPQGPDDQGRRREPHAARGAQEAPTPGAEPAAQAGPTQQPEQPEQAAAAGERPRSESSSFSSKRAAVTAPALGLRGTLLFLWRQLTSMQTALILLMLLAIAAVPGSLYPQRSVNPGLTDQYLAEHGRWGEILDTLGFFEVFSSPWFSAIYLLLFISLIGCIVPRIGVHLRQLRSKPPRTPSRLSRFTGYTRTELPAGDAEPLLAAAHRALRRSRYRTDRTAQPGGGSVSAERGLLRESGNLLFHIALVGVLVCVAGGHLTSYRGQITVVEGAGFSNSLTQYDSFEPGPWFDSSQLPPFQFTLEEFRASYGDGSTPESFGEPLSFEADVLVTTPGEEQFAQTLQVNKPLTVDGASMYLLGNGYAPELTLTDPEGTVVAEGPLITIPMGDMGYTSQLVLKAPDAQPEQTAVVGFFLPTGVIDEQGPHSEYPDLVRPEIAVTAYHGDLGLDEGVPRNAYEVDISELEAVTGEDGNPVLIRLAPGEEYELPDGSVLALDGVSRYAAFDIAHDPFEVWVLVSALAAVAGLVASLFVPRRRVWVRVTEQAGGLVLEVAGLARSDDPALESDVQALADRLVSTHDGDPGPDSAPPEAARDDTPGGSSQ